MAWREDRIMRGLAHVRTRLLVFLIDGGVFDGLLLDADKRTLKFGDVHLRAGQGSEPAAPGETYVERDRVKYTQRVAAEQVT